MRSRTGIANDQWFQIHGGDGFEAQIDPKNSRIIYAESQDGNISRVDKISNERKSIRPLPARGEPPLRWNWNTPILMSPHDPATIYVGANKVFKSTDRGQSWTAISPDLTDATDREGLTLMGVRPPRTSPSPRTTACSRTATSCSWSSRRRRPACSTPAPTMARCT